MEDRALLTRNLCETDRRGVYANATFAGLQLFAEARLAHDAILGEALTEAAQRPEIGSPAKAIVTTAEAA
jgi:DNA-binding MarR family transcriptional regulator